MEMILGLLIPALSGAAGGNIVGKVAGALNGGGLMNTILGAVGGLGAGSILGSMGVDATSGAEAAEAVTSMDRWRCCPAFWVGPLVAAHLAGSVVSSRT